MNDKIYKIVRDYTLFLPQINEGAVSKVYLAKNQSKNNFAIKVI